MVSTQSRISLSELNAIISNALATVLQPTYWVVAEIGEMRTHQRGHCYLELVEKEDDKLVAKTRATIWSSTYKLISQSFEELTGSRLKAGMKVLLQLSVEYHALYGLSLNVKNLDANFTLGERARLRAETIQKLEEAGLLKLNKKFQLEVVPQRLAIITSPTAAGWGDFQHQLVNNPYGYTFKLKLFGASMQGDAAVASIKQALNLIDTNQFDALVIIRGGGARTDLDCFDEYELAKALAQVQLPIISGIGHERDQTVVDMVAHTTLKTPTAVAEFILNRAMRFESYLIERLEGIGKRAGKLINSEAGRVLMLAQGINRSAENILDRNRDKIQRYSQSIAGSVRSQLKFKKQELYAQVRLLQSASNNLLCRKQAELDNIKCQVELQDPERLLSKGYTLTLTPDGKRLSQKPQTGDIVLTKTINFTFKSIVSE
jgi:exodeoxyribonuclease VII large subunit